MSDSNGWEWGSKKGVEWCDSKKKGKDSKKNSKQEVAAQSSADEKIEDLKKDPNYLKFIPYTWDLLEKSLANLPSS